MIMTGRTKKHFVYKLDPLAERCLIFLHASFVLAWLMAALLIHHTLIASDKPTSVDGLYSSHLTLLRVDEFVRVPAMAGVLITSYFIAFLTEPGVCKSRRVKASWLLTLSLTVLNTVFLGPCIIRVLSL